MQNFKQSLIEFWKDEEGLTTVEYAIAGALVGTAVIASFKLLGTNVNSTINGIANALS